MSELIKINLGTLKAVGDGLPVQGQAGAPTVTATVTGVGAVSATVVVRGSNDGAAWTTLATLSPNGSGSAVAVGQWSGDYAYLRADASALSAGASVMTTVAVDQTSDGGGVVGGGRKPYLGVSASRAGVGLYINTTAPTCAGKSLHYARSRIIDPQLSYLHVAMVNTGEVVPTGNCTVQAMIEYPIGSNVFYVATWNGGAGSATMLPGAEALSDPITGLDIPVGAPFGVWTYFTGQWPQMIGSPQIANVFMYDRCEYGAAVANPIGVGGTITSTNPGAYVRPTAIVSKITDRTFGLIGDSRVFGAADTTITDPQGLKGILERALSPKYGTFTMAASSTRASTMTAGMPAAPTNFTRILAMLRYVSDVVFELGINDISSGADNSTLITYQRNFAQWNRAQGRVGFLTTYGPSCTSTDNFRTTANQTPFAQEATRADHNANYLRLGLGGGQLPVIDIARVVESRTSPGRWNADGVTDYLWVDSSGIHETTYACRQIAASSVFAEAGIP